MQLNWTSSCSFFLFFFLGGLKKKLLGIVIVQESQTLQKACGLARLAEATLFANASGSRPVNLNNYSMRKVVPIARSSNFSYQ